MYYKIALNIFFIIFIFILQISFVSSLAWNFNMLNFILISLVFILVYFDFKVAAFWSLGFGFLLDVYSFDFFGIYIISLFLVLILLYFVLVGLLTNRSIYSFLALAAISVFSFQLIIHSLAYVLSFLNESNFVFVKSFFWINILKQIFLNFILTILVFYTSSFISNRFKPVFLIRDKK